MIEIVFEAAFALLFECLYEAGAIVYGRRRGNYGEAKMWLAVVGFALYGALAGGVSLLFFPKLMIRSETLRLLNLILTPLAVGGLMWRLGVWRSRRGWQTIPIERFVFSTEVAFVIGMVRYVWGR